MEETFGTAVPRVFLDLELTYEFNLWFKKKCGSIFPYLQSPQNWEDDSQHRLPKRKSQKNLNSFILTATINTNMRGF